MLFQGLLENRNSSRLEEDEIATFGKEKCDWSCIPSSLLEGIELECKPDCFIRDHCAVKALNEFIKAEGLCNICNMQKYLLDAIYNECSNNKF